MSELLLDKISILPTSLPPGTVALTVSTGGVHQVTDADTGITIPLQPATDHLALINIGSNTHAQIDAHIASASGTYRYVVTFGSTNLPSNGTETSYASGHNSANDGFTALDAGVIEGLSVRSEPARTAGSATFIVSINNVQNNVAGQRVIIDGNPGVEGEIDDVSGLLKFNTPIPYSTGDQIEVRAVTNSWSPTSADTTVFLRIKENV